MKLSNTLLFALVSADEAPGSESAPAPSPADDIITVLDALEEYCIQTYRLPTFKTKPREDRKQWADRWAARKEISRLRRPSVYNG